MSFDSFLQSIADEEARGQLSGIAEKHPQIRQYVDLGERFQPVATRFGERFGEVMQRLEKIDPAKAAEDFVRFPEWIDYHHQNYDFTTGKYKQQMVAEARVVELETELAALRAKGETDVELEQVLKAVKDDLKAEGFVRKTDLVGPDGKSGLVVEAVSNNAAHIERIYRDLTPKFTEHEKVFGEPMPVDAVLEMMGQTPGLTAKEAYERVVAPKRRELEVKATEEKIKKAREEGVAEGRQQAIQSQGGQGVPVSSGGSARGSHFMQRILARREERAKAAGDGRLGDGQATQRGYQDYLKRQMNGGSV